MLTTILIAAASISFFLMVFWLVDVVSVARSAITTTRNALQTMRDPNLDELAREHIVQTAAVRLLVISGSLILRSLLALVAALVPILAADLVGIAPRAATLAFMERWEVILIATVTVTLGYVASARIWSR